MKNWKHSKCSTGEGLDKKDCSATWTNIRNTLLGERSVTQKRTHYIFPFVWHLCEVEEAELIYVWLTKNDHSGCWSWRNWLGRDRRKVWYILIGFGLNPYENFHTVYLKCVHFTVCEFCLKNNWIQYWILTCTYTYLQIIKRWIDGWRDG